MAAVTSDIINQSEVKSQTNRELAVACLNGDLTKPRRRRQRERQKTIGLMSKTTTLHVHHAFLYISLRSLHDYGVK